MQNLLVLVGCVLVICHLSSADSGRIVPKLKHPVLLLGTALPGASNDIQVVATSSDLPKLLALIRAASRNRIGGTEENVGDMFVEQGGPRTAQQIVLIGSGENNEKMGDDLDGALNDIQRVDINNGVIEENNLQGSVYVPYHHNRHHRRHHRYYDQI